MDRVGQTHHYWVTGLLIFPPQSRSPFQGHIGGSEFDCSVAVPVMLPPLWLDSSCLMYYIFWLPPTTHTDKIPAGRGQGRECQHSVCLSFISQYQHACAYERVCLATQTSACLSVISEDVSTSHLGCHEKQNTKSPILTRTHRCAPSHTVHMTFETVAPYTKIIAFFILI